MAPVRQHLFLARTAELTRLVTSLPPETRCSSASLLTTQKQNAVSISRTTPNLSPVVSNIKGIRQMGLFLAIERKYRSNEVLNFTEYLAAISHTGFHTVALLQERPIYFPSCNAAVVWCACVLNELCLHCH